MPTYDYACGACGHRFERMQPILSAPLRSCPKCKRRKVKRLIGGGGGLLFKGSGFYITDYRSKGYAEKAKADAPPEKPKPEKPKEVPKDKAEAKPATPKKTPD